MVKKLIWIESLNANDSTLSFGLPMGPFFNPITQIHFQKQLRSEIGDDWEVSYISQDINQLNEIDGDVIAISENLKGYIDIDKLTNAIFIPFIDVKQKNYAAIIQRIKKFINDTDDPIQ